MSVATRVSAVDSRLERLASADELEENAPEGEEVGALVHGFRANLLGRHVAGRSEERPGLRSPGESRCSRPTRRRSRAGVELREAEIEDLHVPVGGHEEVLRLQIAVQDSLFVGRREAAGDLGHPVERAALRHRAFREEDFPQRAARKQLRHEVVDAGLDPEIVDRSGIAGWFRAEADRASSSNRRIRSASPAASAGENLDRDFTAEPVVLRAPDLAHPARPEGATTS